LCLDQKRLGVDVHHSFGDLKGSEYAHIVFPLQNVDRFVVTPPSDKPPQLGMLIEEDMESIKKRKSAASEDIFWNTTNTYTFSFNTMYMELQNWQAVNLPMMKSIDLHSFWGDSELRMVAYEVQQDTGKSKSSEGGTHQHLKKHEQNKLNYIFCVQAKHMPNGDGGTSESNTDDVESGGIILKESMPWDQVEPRAMRSFVLNEEIEVISEGSSFRKFDEHKMGHDNCSDIGSDGYESESTHESINRVDDEETVGGDTVYHDAIDHYERLISLSSSGLIEERQKLFPRDKLCPGWIDFCDVKNRKYSRFYAFAMSKGETFFCTSKNFERFFWENHNNLDTLTKIESNSDRLSKSEITRRRLGDKYSRFCQVLTTQELEGRLDKLRHTWSRYDSSFMKSEACPKKSPKRGGLRFMNEILPMVKQGQTNGIIKDSSTKILGFMARAVSERHWVEQLASFTKNHVIFSHPSRKVASYRISLGSIVEIRSLCADDGDDLPHFSMFYFSVIETPGRRIYLMHPCEKQREDFVQKLSTQIRYMAELKGRPKTYGSRAYVSDDPKQEYLHKSSVWKCKNRRILNCRKFDFGGTVSERMDSRDPCFLVQRALRSGLALYHESDESTLLEFLDAAADLKAAKLSDLEEYERKCFFLNLYHLMVVHAYFILGAPDNSAKWPSYFNMISYQCADDIFSLAELEHCIIRSPLSRPCKAFSKFVIPGTTYSELELHNPDFRINFALNCGSLSNPPSVFVYTENELDLQLDAAVQMYLSQVVVSKGKTSTSITLPRLCLWYRQDFNTKGSSNSMLQELYPYFSPETQKQLSRDKLDNFSHVQIKFASYDFKCRQLVLN